MNTNIYDSNFAYLDGEFPESLFVDSDNDFVTKK